MLIKTTRHFKRFAFVSKSIHLVLKMCFNIFTFCSDICYVFLVFVIILVDLNVGVSLQMCKKASIYGQNHSGKLPSIERYLTLLTKEYLAGVI